jgi:hypothetical protein
MRRCSLHMAKQNLRSLATILVAALGAACSNGTPDITGSDVNGAMLVVHETQVSGAPNETLTFSATIVNRGTTELASGGCRIPSITLDSATSTGWAPMDVSQAVDLVQCLKPWSLSPGGEQDFASSLTRNGPLSTFPRSVALRLRVLLLGTTSQATSRISIEP